MSFVRRMLGETLLRAGWWYRCGITSVGLAAIAALIKIAFCQSLVTEPARPHVIFSVGNWRALYSRGWPWEFRLRSMDAFGQRHEDDSLWNAWALAGDVLVFAVLVAGIVWLTRRIARSPQWSLRWVSVALTVVCIIGAWFANAYHRSTYDRALRREFWAADEYPTDEYKDPRWFQQLVGEKGGMRELFYRLSDEESLNSPPKREHRVAFYAAMAKRRGLRRLWLDSDAATIAANGSVTNQSSWKDGDVAGLLQLSSLTGLYELNLSHADISSNALVGIAHCRQLRVVDVTGTHVSDEAIDYLSRCPHLKVLRLSGTSITVASLPALQRMSERTAIDASNTGIAAEHLKSFRKPPRKPFGWETDLASRWKRT